MNSLLCFLLPAPQYKAPFTIVSNVSTIYLDWSHSFLLNGPLKEYVLMEGGQRIYSGFDTRLYLPRTSDKSQLEFCSSLFVEWCALRVMTWTRCLFSRQIIPHLSIQWCSKRLVVDGVMQHMTIILHVYPYGWKSMSPLTNRQSQSMFPLSPIVLGQGYCKQGAQCLQYHWWWLLYLVPRPLT